MQLRGKTAIVTGAGSGIGRAIAVELAGNGVAVMCAGRRLEGLLETQAMIKALGTTAAWVQQVDVTEPTDVAQLVAETEAVSGNVDILVNNAGRHGAVKPLWQQDIEDWWADVEVNLRGTMLCCRAALPGMFNSPDAVILNISGGGAVEARPFCSSYACSKAAILRFTDSLAAELQQDGHDQIVVIAFNPGLTRTAMAEAIADSDRTEQWMPVFRQMMEEGKARDPKDCAVAAVTIICQASPVLAGRVLHMDDPLDEILTHPETAVAQTRYLLRRT